MGLTVCFCVPNGLEDIAQDEIQGKLLTNDRLPPTCSEWTVHPGLILCTFRIDDMDLKSKRNVRSELRQMHLFSVERIFLVISIIPVPEAKFRPKSSDDNSWIQWLESCITNHALEPWIEINSLLDTKGLCPKMNDESVNEVLFRASFMRGDFRNSVVNSQLMAGALGASVLSLSLNAKVSLEKFEWEVLGYLVPKAPFAELLLGIGIENSCANSAHISWRHRVVSGRTSLKPTIAFCLAKMANIQPGQVVLDPCCGVGTIPIEASLTCQPYAHYLCGDIELESIRTKTNRNLIAASPYLTSVFSWNAKALPIRDQLVDHVLTDLPWGMREGSFNMCAKLYPKLMKQLIRVVKKGTGRAFILTLDHKLLSRTLNTLWCLKAWRTLFVRDIRIGYQVKLFCLERTEI